jgi:hypothetical protein
VAPLRVCRYHRRTVNGLAVVVLTAAVQSLSVSPDATEPLRLSCPVGRTTRVVLPEALRRMRAPGQNAALDLSIERLRPEGVLLIKPNAHPLHAILEVLGESHSLRLLIESAPSGDGAEFTLAFANPSAPAPTTAVTVESVEARPLSTPAAPAPPATDMGSGLDGVDLLRDKVVVVGQREGLPGQPAMVLTDALQGERWIWLRFVLEGGASARVSRVSWEGGEADSFTAEPHGGDLRVMVRLARATLTRRAHVSLEVEPGATYTFGLDSRPLRELLK